MKTSKLVFLPQVKKILKRSLSYAAVNKKYKSAAGIEHLTNHTLLDLIRNEISELNLSNNTNLEEIFIGNNELTSLDIIGCGKLTYLEVFINQLEALDVSHSPMLESICANKNEIESIDLSQNKELLDLNEPTDIDLSANDKLEKLELANNPLSEIAKSKINQLSSVQVQM